jgi:uncharacterized membrane protein YfcA
MAMTLTVSLEIIEDTFKAPDSRLAKFIGIEPNHSLYEVVRDVVSPGLLALGLFCFGWSAYRAHTASRTQSMPSTKGGVIAGIAMLIVGFLGALSVTELSSIVVCRILLVLLCAVWARSIFTQPQTESNVGALSLSVTQPLDLVAMVSVLIGGWLFIG